MNNKLPIVVFVSGRGSNLQAIIKKCRNVDIKMVISNNIDAYAGVYAINANIPYIIDVPKKNETVEYDYRLSNYIAVHNIKLIVLAGFMRILTPWFIQQYSYQIINIHPSLLPKYKGLNTHQRVFDEKESIHGITIHYVNEKLDSGPIILQRHFDVSTDDTIESLERKTHELEHVWYPAVIDVIAAERVICDKKQ